MGKIIKVVYGEIEEEYIPENYDSYEELLFYIDSFFPFLNGKFQIIEANQNG